MCPSPVSAEQIAGDVQAVYDQYGYCVAAVSEGLLNTDGVSYGETGAVDAFGHAAKGGVVEAIAAIIAEDSAAARASTSPTICSAPLASSSRRQTARKPT